MNNKGQILIPVMILIIVSIILISGIIMFLSQMVNLNLARASLGRAVYAAQAGIYKAIVDYENNGSITAEIDTQIADNLYYSISGGGGTSLRIDASNPRIHGGDRKLDDIDIYNINSSDDAIMDNITISWVDDDGEMLTKINFTGTGGDEWKGSVVSGVEISLSYTFGAGDDEEFKLEWAKGDDITDKTITAAFHFTDGTTKTATLLSAGLASSDFITIRATGKVTARDTWRRTIIAGYDVGTDEIISWRESASHL